MASRSSLPGSGGRIRARPTPSGWGAHRFCGAPKLLAGLAAGLLLAACSGQPTGQQKDVQEAQVRQPGQPGAVECTEGKEWWRGSGVPKRGGTLVRASTGDSEHLDGLVPGRPAIPGTVVQVNQGLFEYRGCFYEDTVVIPRLARGWEVSPDGLSYTLKLRDDVKWHNRAPVNGRAFTSADVAWTIDQQLAGGRVQSYWAGVTHQEPDAHTIRLTLSQPDADFLSKLGHHENLIWAREIKERYGDFKSVAVGTGPFMLKQWLPGQDAVTERNPDYPVKGDDGRPLPYVDEVRSVGINDYTAEVAALRAGQLDHTSPFGLRKLDADAMKQSNPKLRFYPQIQFTHWALWFNIEKQPWADVRVRRAAAMAIDREDLLGAVQGNAVHSAFVPAFLKEYAWAEGKARDKFKPDRDQAKRLLAEAGHAPGSIRVTLKTAGLYRQEAEIVQQHLEAIGIRTTIEIEAQAFSVIVRTRKYDDLAWGAISTPPFVGYYMGDFVRIGSNQNDTRLKDEKVHELAVAQGRELDETKRKAIVDRLQDRLYELMPWVPTLSNLYGHFQACRLRNAKQVNPAYNPAMVTSAWLDPAGC